MSVLVMMWIGFAFLMTLFLALDLFVLNRKAHVITAKEALLKWGMWVVVALMFNVTIYFVYQHAYLPERGPLESLKLTESTKYPANAMQAALMFLQPYIIEQTLSMDNMMVIAMLMAYFKIPAVNQHRVLLWGILGAVVLRAVMILAGRAFVENFSWVTYVFGALLFFSAWKMYSAGEEERDFDKSPAIRAIRKIIPFTSRFDGAKFITLEAGKWVATPMLMALLSIELADAVFAIDSIPATLTFTTDPFLAFSSNCFAVLGLRALYFGVAALISRFVYMKTALIFLLGFIGVKMLIPHKWLHNTVPHVEFWSLGIVLLTLTLGVLVSIYFPPKNTHVVKE